MTYGWHTSTYERHMDYIRVHASNIRMTYEYIRVTYGWYISEIRMTYEWYTSTYDWHANGIRNIKLYNRYGAFRSLFSNLFVLKTLLYAEPKDFCSVACSYSFTFFRIFLSSTTRSGNLNNLKGGRIVSYTQVQR